MTVRTCQFGENGVDTTQKFPYAGVNTNRKEVIMNNQQPQSDAKAIFWTLAIILIVAIGLSPQIGGWIFAGSVLFIIAIPLIMVCGFAYIMYQAFFNGK